MPTEEAVRVPAAESGGTATRILDAAEALFAERGFTGVSVREIAGRVGLNQASIYNHFPSKQALYEAVLDRGFGPMRDLLAARAHGLGTPEARERLLADLIEHLWRTPHLPKLVQREVLDGGEYLDKLTEHWLKPIYEAAKKAVQATPGLARWPEEDLPLLILGMYHLLFGHFASAALLERLAGVDPFSPRMRQAHLEFVKHATDRLLER